MHKKEMQFLFAAKSNDLVSLSKILAKMDKIKAKGKGKVFVDINVRNSDGVTALHYAAKNGNIEMIEELLSRGAFLEMTDKVGWRPLSYASANNHVSSVTKLIDHGSKVNIPGEDNSPIHIAAKIGHRDIVKILMDNGANIHSQNNLRQTPVDVACENNHYGIVNLLLSASSKLIEDFSENSFKSISRKSLNPSLMNYRTATLPAAISNGSHDGFMSLTDEYRNWEQKKDYNNGSQQQISGTDCNNFLSFKSFPAKKSESLNAIFLQDERIADCKTKFNGSDSPKYNTLNNATHSQSKIFLPYPSKFSTSYVLKLKSPLLPIKSSVTTNVDYIQSHNEDPMADEPFSGDKIVETEKCPAPKEDNGLIFRFRKERNRSHSSRTGNKIFRSSLPIQNNFEIAPISPTHYFPSKTSNNNKPMAVKYKERKNLMCKENSYENLYCKGKRNLDLLGTSCKNREASSYHKWVKSIGLLMIWDSLVKDGFDSFLALSLANDDEMLLLCNNRIDYLDVLKTKLSLLNIPTIDLLTFSTDILQILTQLGLEEYSSNFIEEGYFYVKHLPKIYDKLLKQLGILKIGHRKLLCQCFETLHQSEQREGNIFNRSVSSVSQEFQQNKSVSPVEVFYPNDMKSKCHSLPRFSMYSDEPMKRSPPPIPPRSCSIPDGKYCEDFTLDDILSESMCQSRVSPRKKDYCASSGTGGDLSNLDDLVNMLTNLSKDLDSELNHID